jgi:hypothetical protein
MGIHFNYNLTHVTSQWLPSFFHLHRHSFPFPISVYAGIHHPGANQPQKYIQTQGPDKVEAYNTELKAVLEEMSPGDLSNGGTSFLEFYSITDGAYAFDGGALFLSGGAVTIFPLARRLSDNLASSCLLAPLAQVNMEKTHLLLTLLDIAWGDIARRKGLIVPAL